MKPTNKKISIPEAYNDLLCVARMVVDWYEGRLFNGPDERKALYEAAKAALPQQISNDERGCRHGIADEKQCGECAVERHAGRDKFTFDCPHGLVDSNQCGECCIEAGE